MGPATRKEAADQRNRCGAQSRPAAVKAALRRANGLFDLRDKLAEREGLARKSNCSFSGRLFSNASSAYPETKTIRSSGFFLRISTSSVGPSISGHDDVRYNEIDFAFFAFQGFPLPRRHSLLQSRYSRRERSPRAVSERNPSSSSTRQNGACPVKSLRARFVGRPQRHFRGSPFRLVICLRQIARQENAKHRAVVWRSNRHRRSRRSV